MNDRPRYTAVIFVLVVLFVVGMFAQCMKPYEKLRQSAIPASKQTQRK